LPSLEGFAELDLAFAPVATPDLVFDPVVVVDIPLLWCLWVFASAVDIGLASPAITTAATAHLNFIMERLLGSMMPTTSPRSFEQFPFQSICWLARDPFGTEVRRRHCCCGTAERS
jgi:hypothetical protein